ncbi:MAG: 3'(2'),5'-bisphosphate nucleotidase CysQ [Pseudomonadota bacterium]
MPDAAADTELLAQAAEAAGEIALRHFRNDPAVYDKPGEGPVTEADLEINEMLHDRLGRARPGYGWLSEESPDGTARLGAERVFIVDPIDGTRSFINGETGFSVALAVAERGRVIAAAVHLPAREESFTATLGAGALKNGARIAASGASDPKASTVLTARKQLSSEHWPGGVPPFERHFRSSLAWRMCLVAEGRFDCMLTFRDAWEWDIAAGTLIAAEAGAIVTDGRGGAMAFNSAQAKQAGVLAAPDPLHTRLMAYRAPG